MKETASSETPYEYVIVNDNGYLTVYQKDLKTVYFQTDIPYAELHAELQKKIDQGYLIQDAEELYDFLENYSKLNRTEYDIILPKGSVINLKTKEKKKSSFF